jgi:predicted RecB family endonuclease
LVVSEIGEDRGGVDDVAQRLDDGDLMHDLIDLMFDDLGAAFQGDLDVIMPSLLDLGRRSEETDILNCDLEKKTTFLNEDNLFVYLYFSHRM